MMHWPLKMNLLYLKQNLNLIVGQFFFFLEVGSLELDFILVHPVDYVSLSSVYLRDSAQNNLVLTPPPLTPLNFHRLSPNKIRVTAEFER